MTNDTPDPDELSVSERTIARYARILARIRVAATPLTELTTDLRRASLPPSTLVPVPLSLLRALADTIPPEE
jgi:hypothetical protein